MIDWPYLRPFIGYSKTYSVLVVDRLDRAFPVLCNKRELMDKLSID